MKTFIQDKRYIIQTSEYKIVVKFKRYIGSNIAICEVIKIYYSLLPPDYLFKGAEYPWNIRLLKLIARKVSA